MGYAQDLLSDHHHSKREKRIKDRFQTVIKRKRDFDKSPILSLDLLVALTKIHVISMHIINNISAMFLTFYYRYIEAAIFKSLKVMRSLSVLSLNLFC